MSNQTRTEIEQAIEFHLRLDLKFGNVDKKSWPTWLLEIYNKRLEFNEKTN